MPKKAADLIPIIRSIIIDVVDEDSPEPFFTSKQITEAFNQAKDELFGDRPEAFSTTFIRISFPNDIDSSTLSVKSLQSLNGGGMTVQASDAAYLLSKLTDGHGKLSLTFNESNQSSLIYIGASPSGDGSENNITVSLKKADDGETDQISISLTDSEGTEEFELEGVFMDNEEQVLSIETDGTNITVTCGNYGIKEECTKGIFKEDAYFWRIGATSLNGREIEASNTLGVGALEITNSSDETVASWSGNGSSFSYMQYSDGTRDVFLRASAAMDYDVMALDDAPDPFVIPDPNATPAFRFNVEDGVDYEWNEPSELDIQPWAVNMFCYIVAMHLLMRRSKDSFYRKAADTLRKMYKEG